MSKTCKFCNTVLTPDNKVHWHRQCKTCKAKQNKVYYQKYRNNKVSWERHKATSRTHYKANKDKVINRRMLTKYGITLDTYNELIKAQNGNCAICNKPEVALHLGKPKALSVDHCHATGKVRGLLCHACNTGIGSFEDNPELLKQAIAYLSTSL